ncbi:MAG: nitroreductase [Candidatus Omnitrophica bacterium]|jgi:nitroreductase|nr:nitroreductase [Candidatus Omnitrophota bacterium]MDD5081371.1 nitroreductase [Candidatus Omnitrophota bacterium]
MDVNKLIERRRSIRKFKNGNIPQKTIKKIIKAGRWAPSGLNNQPWRFMVFSGKEKERLSEFTVCSEIILSSNKCILVFLDKEAVYNKEKDLLSIGAAIQNILLSASNENLGTCWLGEILKKRNKINKEFNIKKKYQLEAVIALGFSYDKGKNPGRKPIKELIINEDL